MITPNNFREGLIFEDDGRVLQVISYQHHRKSQSRAKVQTKLRDVNSGAIVEINYSSETKFKEVEVHKRDFQYLYTDDRMLHFMDAETFEQVTLPRERLGESVKFMIENMDVIGVFFDGVFRTVELPANVVVTVSSAEPGVKGDSVSNLQKQATTNNGITLKVPLFIKEGDSIRVDTRTGEYLERV